MSTQIQDAAPLSRSIRKRTMRAVVYERYGEPDVLSVATRLVPKRLPGQVLIEVWTSSVNPIDYRFRIGEMKWIIPGGFPRIPGYDVAGIVVDCDNDSTFSTGDRVMAFLDKTRGGALAEYAICSASTVARIPDYMPMEEAAAIPLAGTTALQSLRDHGKIKPGHHVLINGASGGVGMFAVQIAKAYGCKVDAIASAANENFCMNLGADRFYDYRRFDFETSDQHWDLIFDAAGTSSYLKDRAVLNEGGRYVSTEPDVNGILTTLLSWPFSKSGKAMLAKPSGDDLRTLIALYRLGNLNVTIDSRFPMERADDAHRRIERGVDHGKIIVTIV